MTIGLSLEGYGELIGYQSLLFKSLGLAKHKERFTEFYKKFYDKRASSSESYDFYDRLLALFDDSYKERFGKPLDLPLDAEGFDGRAVIESQLENAKSLYFMRSYMRWLTGWQGFARKYALGNDLQFLLFLRVFPSFLEPNNSNGMTKNVEIFTGADSVRGYFFGAEIEEFKRKHNPPEEFVEFLDSAESPFVVTADLERGRHDPLLLPVQLQDFEFTDMLCYAVHLIKPWFAQGLLAIVRGNTITRGVAVKNRNPKSIGTEE